MKILNVYQKGHCLPLVLHMQINATEAPWKLVFVLNELRKGFTTDTFAELLSDVALHHTSSSYLFNL